MKQILIIAIILAFAPSIFSQSKDSRRLDQSSRSAQVDALMAPWSKEDTPGAAVIVIKDGKILHKKGYGLANLETKAPITPDTAFLLGSVTKQFTAMAVMILAERGKLKYDDPLSKFFPEFPPYARQITIRHLLNHTSGLPDYEELFAHSGRIDKDWPRSSKEKPSSFEPTAKDALNLLAEQKALRFIPGNKWEYSNSGYVVLARIVEKVSGESFRQFLKENIFKPLGMKRSLVYDETRPVVENRAMSYTLKENTYRDIDYTPLNFIYGEDNVYSTIEDLYKWDQALYTEEVVKASTIEQAFTSGKLIDGTDIYYGFGWEVGDYFGLKFVSHSGRWVGFGSVLVRYLDQHLTVIVLSNLAEFNVLRMTNRIARVYLADNIASPVAAKVKTEVPRKYVGKYQTRYGTVVKVTLENGDLWTEAGGVRDKLVPESETRFFVEGNETSRITFDKDEKGNVRGYTRSSLVGRSIGLRLP